MDATHASLYNLFMDMDFTKGSGNALADRRYELALQLAEWGDFTASADILRQGIDMSPQWPPFHFYLGEALRLTNQTQEAIDAFQHYLKLDNADRMGATIKLSIMGAIPTPSKMPEEYIRSLFDQYAPRFEKCLVENLHYHAPELMAAAIMKVRPAGFNNLLDLGCGTGLAAQQFTQKTSRMVGVDMAPGMIHQCRIKNIYSQLHVADIDGYLMECDEKFDLVLAADLFIYIGDLAPTFKKIASVMTPNSLFCLTAQCLSDGKDWVLGADHRYAHADSYINQCAIKAGLSLVSTEQIMLREDAAQPVQGTIHLFAHQ